MYIIDPSSGLAIYLYIYISISHISLSLHYQAHIHTLVSVIQTIIHIHEQANETTTNINNNSTAPTHQESTPTTSGFSTLPSGLNISDIVSTLKIMELFLILYPNDGPQYFPLQAMATAILKIPTISSSSPTPSNNNNNNNPDGNVPQRVAQQVRYDIYNIILL